MICLILLVALAALFGGSYVFGRAVMGMYRWVSDFLSLGQVLDWLLKMASIGAGALVLLMPNGILARLVGFYPPSDSVGLLYSIVSLGGSYAAFIVGIKVQTELLTKAMSRD